VDRDIPLIGIISRLADQKGLDLVADIIDNLLNMKLQFVLLGTGDNKYHILFEKIAKKYPRNSSIHIKFDATLAQKIYAASDIFLVPSRYEPCGLSQMICFKYGTAPVVRQTGGLKDTVHEFDPATGKGNGFTFADAKPKELLAAIKKALELYREKELWRGLVKRDMLLDFSWKRSAGDYIKLYEKILKKK
jgi:starch synthase